MTYITEKDVKNIPTRHGNIKIVVLNNDVWFIAKDLLSCISSNNSHCASTTVRRKVSNQNISCIYIKYERQTTRMIIINKVGLNELFDNLKKPELENLRNYINTFNFDTLNAVNDKISEQPNNTTDNINNAIEENMSNKIEIFTHEQFGEVRTVIENEKILFCASDIAKALGYTNPNKAVNDHCTAITKRYSPISGKTQQINFIPEGDIYRLILRSRLQSTKKFEHWIFDEIIPSIRKTGSYMTPDTLYKCLSDPRAMANILIALADEQDKNKKLAEENTKLIEVVEEQKPKVTYYDTIMSNPHLIPITIIAKDYGMTGSALNNLLNDWKIQFKRGNYWSLYAQYQNKGYTHTMTMLDKNNGAVYTSMQWTQLGRKFIYDTMKSHGYLPLIEINEKNSSATKN